MKLWRFELYADASLELACVTAYVLAASGDIAADLVRVELKSIQVKLYLGTAVEVLDRAVEFKLGTSVRMTRYISGT